MKSVILLTGAGTGIGKLSAQALAEAGHIVYATMRDVKGRNKARADALRTLAEQKGIQLHPLELDILSQASADAAAAKRGIVGLLDAEQRLTHIARGLEHVADGTQTRPIGCPIEIPMQIVEQLLGGAEITGGQYDEDAIGRGLDDVKFAIRADVVDAGRDARITRQHQALVELDSQAIGHGRFASGSPVVVSEVSMAFLQVESGSYFVIEFAAAEVAFPRSF